MNLPLKILKQNEESFVPVTTAEAVMVKNNAGVRRLDEVLNLKIEGVSTPAGSGLTSHIQDKVIVVTHSVNNLTPNNTPEPKLIQYNNTGHVIGTANFGVATVKIKNDNYATYNGSSDSTIQFGDDFKNENGNIQIDWNNLANE